MSNTSLWYAFGCAVIGILTILIFRFSKSVLAGRLENLYRSVYFILLMALVFAVGYFRSGEMVHLIWNILLMAFILLIVAAIVEFVIKRCWPNGDLTKTMEEKNE